MTIVVPAFALQTFCVWMSRRVVPSKSSALERFCLMLQERVQGLERELHFRELHPLCTLSMDLTISFQFTAFEDSWLVKNGGVHSRDLADAIAELFEGELEIMHCCSPITAARESQLRGSMCTVDSDALLTPGDLEQLFARRILLVEGVVKGTGYNYNYIEDFSRALVKAFGDTFTPAQADFGLFKTRSLQNPICLLDTFSKVCQQKPQLRIVPALQLWQELIVFAGGHLPGVYTSKGGKVVTAQDARKRRFDGNLSSSFLTELRAFSNYIFLAHPDITRAVRHYSYLP